MTGAFRPFDADLEPTGEEGRRARSNRREAFLAMVEHALSNQPLDRQEVARWHSQLWAGLSQVPDPCYLGGYRGSAHAWLRNYEVRAGSDPGLPASQVAEELERFFSELDQRGRDLAAVVPPEHEKDREAVRRVAELAAWAHGEWLRIHPFANGNGRTARLVANHVLARFRLHPVIRLRPRPEPPYLEVARSSMKGDPESATTWIVGLLEAYPGAPQVGP